MILKYLSLQNFRNYAKSSFDLSEETTLIAGPNTSGKTNLLEAIFLLCKGTSFRADKDMEMIQVGRDIARVGGRTDQKELEVIITPFKKYLVNGVGKRRTDFTGNLVSVLFSPVDLEIVVDSPGLRRGFLDSVLEQTNRDYRIALMQYSKGLRQRNALLESLLETGILNNQQFEYWDGLLIETGQVITKTREQFIEFINKARKDIFDFTIVYDKSVISQDRLSQYKQAERAAGVTLVGPHRDDIGFMMNLGSIKSYGSRGQQRLTILQLKLLEFNFIEEKIGERPILLLDDIFSELDEAHIKHVLQLVGKQQTIITTTHKEFVPTVLLKKIGVIELGEQ